MRRRPVDKDVTWTIVLSGQLIKNRGGANVPSIREPCIFKRTRAGPSKNRLWTEHFPAAWGPLYNKRGVIRDRVSNGVLIGFNDSASSCEMLYDAKGVFQWVSLETRWKTGGITSNETFNRYISVLKGSERKCKRKSASRFLQQRKFIFLR